MNNPDRPSRSKTRPMAGSHFGHSPISWLQGKPVSSFVRKNTTHFDLWRSPEKISAIMSSGSRPLSSWKFCNSVWGFRDHRYHLHNQPLLWTFSWNRQAQKSNWSGEGGKGKFILLMVTARTKIYSPGRSVGQRVIQSNLYINPLY